MGVVESPCGSKVLGVDSIAYFVRPIAVVNPGFSMMLFVPLTPLACPSFTGSLNTCDATSAMPCNFEPPPVSTTSLSFSNMLSSGSLSPEEAIADLLENLAYPEVNDGVERDPIDFVIRESWIAFQGDDAFMGVHLFGDRSFLGLYEFRDGNR